MIDESSTLAKAAPPTLWSAVHRRASKPHIAAWRLKRARLNEWFAEAAALDAQTAALDWPKPVGQS